MDVSLVALDNPLEDLIGYQLRRTSASVMAGLANDLKQCGLTPTEGSVLLLIAANAGVTQSQLGRALGIQRANMTPLVAGFDRRGLIRRNRVNGRSHGLEVTNEGALVADRVRTEMQAHDRALAEQLPPITRQVFVEALAALWHHENDQS